MNFENRTVLLTGAAGHLGRAVAAAFAGCGANLVLVDRQAGALDAAFASLPHSATVAADLLDPPQLQQALQPAIELFHRVGRLRGERRGRQQEAERQDTRRADAGHSASSLVNQQ